MTRASDLRALALRVEQATGADRILDAEIVWRTTPGVVGIERGPLDDDDSDYLFEWWPRRPWSASWLTVPAFTASLDAAASLVPEGWKYLAGRDDFPAAYAQMWRNAEDGFAVNAATPALALTAAALRALAEEAGE